MTKTSNKPTLVKFRACKWGSTESAYEAYGIEAKANTGRWVHCTEGSRLLLFDNKEERDKKLKQLREEFK